MDNDVNNVSLHVTSEEPQTVRSRKSRRTLNPLQAGIFNFVAAGRGFPPLQENDVPKRYTRYGSLLLLGSSFASYSVPWTEIFGSLTDIDKADLFFQILKAFRDDSATHVAINAPIPAANTSTSDDNVMRSPAGFQPVYGDFGPCEYDERTLSRKDFSHAYWVNTSQLSNIVQVWAPRWTMFSRGNISEKARILQGNLSSNPFPGLDEVELGQPAGEVDVVDFFVGIGYFAFCYLKRGIARVWGWEINGWSVEGLRRGCIENGWGVRVIRVDPNGNMLDGQNVEDLIGDIRQHENTPDPIRCIVFWGDNKWASKILQAIQTFMNIDRSASKLNIRHCNLGLLPTSENSWADAVRVLSCDKGGWIHIHENVASADIDVRKQYILQQLGDIVHENGRKTFARRCCHVEHVKTYAPGVVHCVYDIEVYPLG